MSDVRWMMPRDVPPHVQARVREVIEETVTGLFDYPADFIGNSGPVSVFCDPSLGAPGLAAAQALLASAASAYSVCQGYFGISGDPVNAIIAPLSGSNDGSGGTYHYGCDFATGGDLYLDAAFGDAQMEMVLFIAALSECFMGLQARGWDCSSSAGEALSRFLGEQPQALGGVGAFNVFVTGPVWASAGHPNWIDIVKPTDQDDVSTGCGVVYLWWMVSLGFPAAEITQAGGATLAANYQILTGKTTAWADFSAAVEVLKGGVTSDNPWLLLSDPLEGKWHDGTYVVTLPKGYIRAVSQNRGQITIYPRAKVIEIPTGYIIK